MKKSLFMLLPAAMLLPAVGLAQNAFVGTWKVDVNNNLQLPKKPSEYLLTGERSLIKLPKSLAPKDVAPYTDAGLTAYRAAKKASRHLLPGQFAELFVGETHNYRMRIIIND